MNPHRPIQSPAASAFRAAGAVITATTLLVLAGALPASAKPAPLEEGRPTGTGNAGTGGDGFVGWTPLLMGVAVVLVIAIAVEIGVLRRRRHTAHA